MVFSTGVKKEKEIGGNFLDYLKAPWKMEPFKSSLLDASWCYSCSVVRYTFKLCKWVHIYPFMWDFYLILQLPPFFRIHFCIMVSTTEYDI